MKRGLYTDIPIQLFSILTSEYYTIWQEFTKCFCAHSAVFGGLDLFGAPRTITWTHLATTADSGSDTITLETAVDWTVDDEIVMTTTSFNPWETETFKIASVSEDMKTLTLNASLQYKHLCKLSNTLLTG